jgi:hypothetical protein
MKINSILLTLLIPLFLINCNSKENLPLDEELDLTPEVLTGSESSISLSSFSKRYDSDIISKLYLEALDNDEKLNILNDKIKNFTNDSIIEKTKAFTKYSNINDSYWNSIDNYISLINDSIIKNETIAIFSKLKLNYKNSIDDQMKLLSLIDTKKEKLRDQLTLMKLFVTEPMMRNYQINEKPDIKELEDLISQYKDLVKESKGYTKLKN